MDTAPEKNQNNVVTPGLESEFIIFDEAYNRALKDHNPLYQTMLDYINGSPGKRIRPLIVFLSSKLCGTPNKQTIDLAVIMELIHNATLIHDDIVDNTMERRGRLSVNGKYDNRMAVLLGDYVLTLAIKLGIRTKDMRILEILARVAQVLVDGELTQLISSRRSIVDEDRYFEVIYKKTAILLSSCSEMGAIAVDAVDTDKDKLCKLGEYIGICFQIRDDIFDYYEQGDIGKPTGNDIREGKVTLPLIYALNNAPEEIASSMRKIIDQQDFSSQNIAELIRFAKEYKGIEYAQSKMQEIKDRAMTLLYEFPESEARLSMERLISYIIDRKK